MPKAHYSERNIASFGALRRKAHHAERHIATQGKQKPRKSGAFLTDYYFYYLLFLMKSLSFLVSIFQ